MTLKQFQNVSKMVKIVVYVKCVNVVCKEKFQKKILVSKKIVRPKKNVKRITRTVYNYLPVIILYLKMTTNYF